MVLDTHNDFFKAKLQTITLKFGVFGFYTLKFQNLNFIPRNFIPFVSEVPLSIFFIKCHINLSCVFSSSILCYISFFKKKIKLQKWYDIILLDKLIKHLTKNMDKGTTKQNRIILLYLFEKNARTLLELWTSDQNTP